MSEHTLGNRICYRPIGIIHSGHHDPNHGPIQPCYARDCPGTVEIFAEYANGLRDTDGYSHIYLIYHQHTGQSLALCWSSPSFRTLCAGYFPPAHQDAPAP